MTSFSMFAGAQVIHSFVYHRAYDDGFNDLAQLETALACCSCSFAQYDQYNQSPKMGTNGFIIYTWAHFSKNSYVL